MKVVLGILLTGMGAWLLGLFLPWWTIAIVAFIVAILIKQSSRGSFISGFLGIALLWIALAAFIDFQNMTILSQRIAQLLPLGGSSLLLIIVTGLIGGLVGGFAALTGSYMPLVKPTGSVRKGDNYYSRKGRHR